MKTYEKWLIGFMALIFFAIIGIQVGIYEGRKLGREEINRENKVEIIKLQMEIAEKKKEIERYEHADKIYQLIQCESSNKHNLWGDNGKSYGWLQFQEKTFYYLAKLAKLEGLNWKDKYHQLILVSWAIENGYDGYWTCSKKQGGKIKGKLKENET